MLNFLYLFPSQNCISNISNLKLKENAKLRDDVLKISQLIRTEQERASMTLQDFEAIKVLYFDTRREIESIMIAYSQIMESLVMESAEIEALKFLYLSETKVIYIWLSCSVYVIYLLCISYYS